MTDDDPIRYTITNWDLYTDPTTSDLFIVGICHNNDSIFAFTLNTVTDDTDYSLLYTSDRKKELRPNAKVILCEDINNDSLNELILFVELRGSLRRVFCLDVNTLSILWTRDVSSGINAVPTFDSVSNRTSIIFVTGNPSNGMNDSIFVDRYSYLARIDDKGEIKFAKKIGVYLYNPPRLIRSDTDREFFLLHYLDLETADSIKGKSSDEYFLSRIDVNSKVVKSIPIKSSPKMLWIIRDQNNIPYLFVSFQSKEISKFDMELNLIEEIDGLPQLMSYLGKTKIADLNDSVLVFNDGIYDISFTKILQFPFETGSFDPTEFSADGDMRSFIIQKPYYSLIGSIEKKTGLELISVYYHRNQIYVIIILTGLFVGLVMSAYYHRKSNRHAKLIEKQKRELEKTHLALKEAQNTIIAQEKFRQAKNIAGGFAHEIRNSLFPARSALSKLRKATVEKLTDRQWTDKVGLLADHAVERAIELTSQVSRYTRLDSDRKVEPVDINELIKKVIDSNSATLEQKKIQVEINTSITSPVLGNCEQFYIVINNLLLNAVDAVRNSEHPLIKIESTKSNSKIILTITDNGTGISNNEINKIFDVFYSTKPNSGSGLGLSMSKKILELYDSSIEVKSTPNEGSTFLIRFQKFSVGEA